MLTMGIREPSLPGLGSEPCQQSSEEQRESPQGKWRLVGMEELAHPTRSCPQEPCDLGEAFREVWKVKEVREMGQQAGEGMEG